MITKKCFFIIFVVTHILYLSIKCTQTPLDQLLTDPAFALKETQKLSAYYFNKKLNSIVPEYDAHNPFDCAEIRKNHQTEVKRLTDFNQWFLLNETPLSYKKICLYSRNTRPHFRAAFETYVSSVLCQKIAANPNKIISYVGFNSCHAYPDFLILAKTLKQNPQAKLDIHLIHSAYLYYTMLKFHASKNREVLIQDDCASQDFNELVKKIMPESQSFATKISNFLKVSLTLEVFFQQFLQNLQNNFPYAQLRLFAHSSAATYFQCITTDNLPHADFFIAADQIEENEINVYLDSCRKILCVQNSSLFNAWLAENKEKKPAFLSVSMNKLNEQSQQINPLLPGYISVTDITELTHQGV